LSLQDDEDGRDGARAIGSTGRQSLNAQLSLRARRRDWQVPIRDQLHHIVSRLIEKGTDC
jgi:hypothetical protein